MGVCNCSMFCCTLLYVHSSIAIILVGKKELIALLNLSSWCLVMVERLFLTVPRGCLQFVIVVFPDHTHLLFLSCPRVREASLSHQPAVKVQRNLCIYYSKTCVKQPLSKRLKLVFKTHYRLMRVNSIAEYSKGHSAILSTFIKLPYVIKIFVLSISEWPFYTGFTVFSSELSLLAYIKNGGR